MSPFSFEHICPVLHTVMPGDTLFSLAQRYSTTVSEIMGSNPGVDLSTLTIGQRICIWPGNARLNTMNCPGRSGISQAEQDLKNQLRLLWEAHITWTRLTIISMVFNLPDVDLTTQRLLRNPEDFEKKLAPLYGAPAAERFADLLRDHLVIAAQLVSAAKAGDTRTADEAERKWYDNARDIAALLGSINPYWSQTEWQQMLFEHLALVKSEAVDMMNKNYLAEINLYDEMERQAMVMADNMAEGIIRQFPDRFI